MQVWSLASGSAGNAYLLRAEETLLLVDCGLSLRVLSERLGQLGLHPAQLSAVLVTHEHTDHLGGVPSLVKRYSTPVYATAGTLAAAADRLPADAPRQTVVAGRPFQLGAFTVRPFAVPHDAAEPVAYHLSTARARACILTDLGHVPAAVLPYLRETELLVLEFNHDAEQLARGPYHPELKRRIAGPLGHLSNHAAACCLLEALSGSQEVVWLAHLSEVNNSQRSAREAALWAVRAAGRRPVSVQVAERRALSLRWDLDAPRQLRLF